MHCKYCNTGSRLQVYNEYTQYQKNSVVRLQVLCGIITQQHNFDYRFVAMRRLQQILMVYLGEAATRRRRSPFPLPNPLTPILDNKFIAMYILQQILMSIRSLPLRNLTKHSNIDCQPKLKVASMKLSWSYCSLYQRTQKYSQLIGL